MRGMPMARMPVRCNAHGMHAYEMHTELIGRTIPVQEIDFKPPSSNPTRSVARVRRETHVRHQDNRSCSHADVRQLSLPPILALCKGPLKSRLLCGAGFAHSIFTQATGVEVHL